MTVGLQNAKSMGRPYVVCCAAPGSGKSAFFDEFLKNPSLFEERVNNPGASPVNRVVPLSVTFNLNTSFLDEIEKDRDGYILDVKTTLLCRLIYK